MKRRREGGGDLVTHLCNALTNAGQRRGDEYAKRIRECTCERRRTYGMFCLKVLHLNVSSMSMRYGGKLKMGSLKLKETLN